MINTIIQKTAQILICTILLAMCDIVEAAENIKFCGGPSGGTFIVYANAIANLMRKNYIGVTVVPTKGAIDNIRAVDSGEADFGVTYAEDVYHAINGKTDGDDKKYTNVRVVGPLYQAAMVIAVKSSSGIRTLRDIAGKRIGVGESGSGSAASVKRILQPAGLWGKVTQYYIGYRAAVPAFNQGAVDAIWIYSGTPNPTITEMCRNEKISLIPIQVGKDIRRGLPGFYSQYTIPAGTYGCVGTATPTIAGSAVWIAGANVKNEKVKAFMSAIYQKQGMANLKAQSAPISLGGFPTVRAMSLPMHPAAKAYWRSSAAVR